MDDESEAWALAIHEALSADPEGPYESVSGHARIDRRDGKPQSGWIDGEVSDLGDALRAAGWTPPSGVVERWQSELAAWPQSLSGVSRSG